MTEKKRTRRELIAIIEQLQDHLGEALGLVDDDRSESAKSRLRAALMTAHGLCIESREHDPPRRGALAKLQRALTG